MSAAAAPTLALGPLQSRYSPAIGRLRVVRSASPAPSGPLRALQASGGTLGYPLKRPSTPVPAAADLRCGQRRQHPHRCRPDASSATILRLHHPHPCQLNRDPRTVVSYRGRCPSSRWRSGHGEQVAIAGSEVSGQAGAPSGAGSYPQCPQDAVPLPRTPHPVYRHQLSNEARPTRRTLDLPASPGPTFSFAGKAHLSGYLSTKTGHLQSRPHRGRRGNCGGHLALARDTGGGDLWRETDWARGGKPCSEHLQAARWLARRLHAHQRWTLNSPSDGSHIDHGIGDGGRASATSRATLRLSCIGGVPSDYRLSAQPRSPRPRRFGLTCRCGTTSCSHRRNGRDLPGTCEGVPAKRPDRSLQISRIEQKMRG